MSQKVSKAEVFRYLESWDGFEKRILEEGEAYKVTVINGNKSIVITTPYEVGEFYLDFYVDDKHFYSDWYEIMDDPLSEFMPYTKHVVEQFLFFEVRVVSRGWWIFKTFELQFQKNGTWHNVFNAKT